MKSPGEANLGEGVLVDVGEATTAVGGEVGIGVVVDEGKAVMGVVVRGRVGAAVETIVEIGAPQAEIVKVARMMMEVILFFIFIP